MKALSVALTTMTAAAALGLSGCVVVDTTPQEGVAHSAAPSTAPTASATDTSMSTPAPNPPTSSPSVQPSEAAINLAPAKGVQYLHAVQAFSPALESWVVDKTGGELEYTRYTCLGSVQAAGSGALAQLDGDRWQVTWDGKSPMLYSRGPTERLMITDRSLTHGSRAASARTDLELERYIGMCKEAGKGVAGFVLATTTR